MENNSIINNQNSSEFIQSDSGILASRYAGSLPGMNIRGGRILYYPIRRPSKSKETFQSSIGECDGCWGFDPDMPDSMQSHINGECNDMIRPQKWVPTTFPFVKLPRLQFATARRKIPGYTSTDTSFPGFTLQVKMDSDTANSIVSTIMNHNTLSDGQASLIADAVKNRINTLSDSILDSNLFTESFNIIYALRLADGEEAIFSHPIYIHPNNSIWRVAFTSAISTGDGIAVQCVVYRGAVKIAVRLPDCEYNREWKNQLNSINIYGKVTAIDIFASPGSDRNPKEYKVYGSKVSIPADTDSDIISEGVLKATGNMAKTSYSGLLLQPDNNYEILSRTYDPEAYRLAGTIQLGDLPIAEYWKIIDLSAAALYDSKTSFRIPDYESARSGWGDIMTTAAGSRITGNVSFMCDEAIPPIYTSPQKADKSTYSLITPTIYLGIRKGGEMIYLRRQSSSEWNDTENGYPALFHPQEDVEEIVEEIMVSEKNNGAAESVSNPPSNPPSKKYRIYKLYKLSSGGRRWLAEKENTYPEWIEEEFESNHTVISLESYSEPHPEIILCSAPEIPGWYPEKSRIIFPEGEKVSYIGWYIGSGNYSLLAFTNEGIRKLTRKEYTHYSIPLQTWEPDTLISQLTCFMPESVINIRSGVIFIGMAGVMYLNGNSMRRLSKRGDMFPEDSFPVYHQGADLLEIRVIDDEKERSIWVYDMEDGKELVSDKRSPEDILNISLKDFNGTELKDKITAYRVITLPFRIKQSNQRGELPVSIRICGKKGIGNYKDIQGLLILQTGSDLYNWETLEMEGMEISYPFGEGGLTGGNQWLRLGIFATKEWGIPTGIEITLK